MVYRGKPSAGCENCRKAKKRCDLEQPACTRCRKLKKDCGGYRDVSQLQIQDESQAVIQKANRHKHRASTSSASPVLTPSAQLKLVKNENTIPTPSAVRTPGSERSFSSDCTVALPYHGNHSPAFVNFDATVPEETSAPGGTFMTFTMKPTPDDLGTTYFFSQFTSDSGHWAFLRNYEKRAKLNPVLSYATKACGLAALDNVHGVEMGRSYSRTLYAQALGLLNAALRDPKQSKTDESLIAVAMLGYFENVTCDSRESIESWKAHIRGATQLLKLRGKAQFNSAIGRMLFRETRAQILINLIWDDLEPPSFLIDWHEDLQKATPDLYWMGPADDFTMITFEFAQLRYKMRVQTISHPDAMAVATDIEMRLVKWSVDLMSTNPFWRYREVEVPDSPDIWNGLAHVYNGLYSASVWGIYRNIRIMLTRTQEFLVRRLGLSLEQQEKQMNYLKSVRRQMTDEICLGIPTQLGHAPCSNSPNILITAYGSIWPLFFAGTCALERIGPGLWSTVLQDMTPNLEANTSAALAQAMWIIGRMEYISKVVGLRWADGVAATLRGDFAMHEELLPEYGEADGKSVHMFWRERLAEMRRNQVPEWVKKIQESGRGPRVTMEENAPLSTGILEGSYPEGLWAGRVEVDEAKKYRAHSMDISNIINS
ncbi:Putative zn(2)-C6 fungal-type DNA-binding domain, fungal transcription factor [Septoria linicola]|uniref:Zn(2)-C6 fungal-type DNA-binding domain, fungal transcription factor n=1 Tax=Septoria linicola TaxID=215465 RepID=A0A9Q9AWU1_9PEZI|nr:putative zn(2)-C6 fungal-type DNA-binding domain, fungal transcription factor [Septoria linicola]USW53965.1 Putative zn(2)-C6 fungal-type DNA-binding domain, fungal transcription factor [Septoria linicola]